MIYAAICDIIEAENIRTLEDVELLKIGGSLTYDASDRACYRLSFVTSDDYPWVKDVFLVLQHIYKSVLEDHKRLGLQSIIVGDSYDNFLFHTWSIRDEIFRVKAKLACLYPKKMLVMTQKAILDEDTGIYWLPIDFLAHAVCFAPLLRAGYISLLPKRLRCERGRIQGSENIQTTYYHLEAGNFTSIPSSGSGWQSLQKKTSDLERPLDCILNLPWLMTKDIRHCIDVIQKYPDEFAVYSEAFTAALACPDAAALSKWATEVIKATRELDLIYKNKMKELNAKGWETLIGVIPSMVAFALPDSPVKQVLAPLIAGKSAIDATRWLFDIRQAKNLLSNHKHWIIWRMKF